MKRIPWDKYESALLVEAYWQIAQTPSKKSLILKNLSITLRQRAIRKGMEIDSFFRNYNGMKIQYALLEYLVTDGNKGLSGNIAKTIAEVEAIYENDQTMFLEILKQAKY